MYLVISDTLVDVTDSGLSSIGICSRVMADLENMTKQNHAPTGVMWERTWVPSIPTQLKVE